VLTAEDFANARDRILLGRREGSNVLLPEEKHAVAVHEAGHALVAVLSDHADPVAKVTILPAGQALGVTEQLPLVERHLYGEEYLLESLGVRLGGRAAELVELGQGSTGASNDLASATDLATRMVREFGLSPALGPVGYPEGGSVFLPGGNGQGVSSRPFAEETQATIDREVARLLREAEARAVDLISSHREELGKIVDLLVEHETVDGAAVYQIVGRPVPEHRPEEMAIAPRAVSSSGATGTSSSVQASAAGPAKTSPAKASPAKAGSGTAGPGTGGGGAAGGAGAADGAGTGPG
jgi:cell division protease FtsH